MAKVNPRLEMARSSYREALAAGKERSAAEEAPRSRRGRKPGARPAAEPPQGTDVERID